MGRANLRLDYAHSQRTDLTFIADAHDYAADQTLALSTSAPPWLDFRQTQFESRGGSVQGRWVHERSSRATWSAQSYVEWVDREVEVLYEERLTWDVELQYDLALNDRSHFAVGGAYRRTSDDMTGGPDLLFDFGQAQRTDELWGAFVQWQWAMVPDRLDLTLGTKVEDHPYTAPELQPTARLLYSPADQHSVWGAVSRAVRSPSRSEIAGRYNFRSVLQPGQPVAVIVALGNTDMESENLVAYEIGYRFVPERAFSLDVAAFVNQYDDLLGVQIEGLQSFTDPPPGYVITETRIINAPGATAWGAEVSARWQPIERLRLSGFYAYFDADFGQGEEMGTTETARHYRHGVMLRSELDLRSDLRLDAMLHFHSPILGEGDLESVERLDAALSWQVRSDLEFSLVGQSLLHSSQREFQNAGWEVGTEVQRTVFAMFRWSR